jgi:hypothetical protein
MIDGGRPLHVLDHAVFNSGQFWAGFAGRKKYMRGEKAARKEGGSRT